MFRTRHHNAAATEPGPKAAFLREKFRPPITMTWRSDGGILTGAPENAVFGPGTRIFGGLIWRPQERGLTARGPGMAAVARASRPWSKQLFGDTRNRLPATDNGFPTPNHRPPHLYPSAACGRNQIQRNRRLRRSSQIQDQEPRQTRESTRPNMVHCLFLLPSPEKICGNLRNLRFF